MPVHHTCSPAGSDRLSTFESIRSKHLSAIAGVAPLPFYQRVEFASANFLQSSRAKLHNLMQGKKMAEAKVEAIDHAQQSSLPINDFDDWEGRIVAVGQDSARYARTALELICEYETKRQEYKASLPDDSRYVILHQIKLDIVDVAKSFSQDKAKQGVAIHAMVECIHDVLAQHVFSSLSGSDAVVALNSVTAQLEAWQQHLQGQVQLLDELQGLNTRLDALLDSMLYPLLQLISDEPLPIGLRSYLFLWIKAVPEQVLSFINEKSLGKYLHKTLLMPPRFEPSKHTGVVAEANAAVPTDDVELLENQFKAWFAKRTVNQLIKDYIEERKLKKGGTALEAEQVHQNFINGYASLYVAMRNALLICYKILPDLETFMKQTGENNINSTLGVSMLRQILVLLRANVELVNLNALQIFNMLKTIGPREKDRPAIVLWLITSPQMQQQAAWYNLSRSKDPESWQAKYTELSQQIDQVLKKCSEAERQQDAYAVGACHGPYLFLRDHLIEAKSIVEVATRASAQESARSLSVSIPSTSSQASSGCSSTTLSSSCSSDEGSSFGSLGKSLGRFFSSHNEKKSGTPMQQPQAPAMSTVAGASRAI